MAEPRRTITISAAAAQLGVHPETLRRAIRAGKMACYRMGGCVRLAPEHIDAYLESSLCPARDPQDPGLNSAAASGASSGGTATNVDGFRLAQQMRSTLDRPSRISRPRLHAIPSG